MTDGSVGQAGVVVVVVACVIDVVVTVVAVVVVAVAACVVVVSVVVAAAAAVCVIVDVVVVVLVVASADCFVADIVVVVVSVVIASDIPESVSRLIDEPKIFSRTLLTKSLTVEHFFHQRICVKARKKTVEKARLMQMAKVRNKPQSFSNVILST